MIEIINIARISGNVQGKRKGFHRSRPKRRKTEIEETLDEPQNDSKMGKNTSNMQEYLQLGLEEAFFLLFGVKCLKVMDMKVSY